MEKFVKKLEQSNRKLVTIIDPHLRVNKDKKQIVQDEIKATEPKLELENKIIETNEQLENEDIYHISERLLKEGIYNKFLLIFKLIFIYFQVFFFFQQFNFIK